MVFHIHLYSSVMNRNVHDVQSIYYLVSSALYRVSLPCCSLLGIKSIFHVWGCDISCMIGHTGGRCSLFWGRGSGFSNRSYGEIAVCFINKKFVIVEATILFLITLLHILVSAVKVICSVGSYFVLQVCVHFLFFSQFIERMLELM